MARILGKQGRLQREAWQYFCDEVGAEYIVSQKRSKYDSVHAMYKSWDFVFDTFARSTGKTTILYTRVVAHYINSDSFRFRINRAGILSGLGKKLGMQDVVVGHPPFDKDFIIQGNDELKLKMFFEHDRIRELLHGLPPFILEIKPDENWAIHDFREGKSELYFEATGIHYKDGIMFRLYDLFAEVLDQLHHLGSAHENHL